MARSIKKKNYIKDSGSSYSKYMKRLSHSRVRLESKRRIKRGDWDSMPLNRELTNQWDVCDWKSYFDQEKMFEFYDVHQTIDNGYLDWYKFHRLRWSPHVMYYKGLYHLRK